eukprot:UN07081
MLGVQFDRAHEYSLTNDVQGAFDKADGQCGDDRDVVFDEFWKIQYNSQYADLLDTQAFYDKSRSLYGSTTNGSGKWITTVLSSLFLSFLITNPLLYFVKSVISVMLTKRKYYDDPDDYVSQFIEKGATHLTFNKFHLIFHPHYVLRCILL